ncbi:MAG: DEAD/DEAH box helicase [Bacteroidales bacterium]|nr:DEAD/DEAH box helicase [Bacteroidales bacterium]MCF8397164.1 DEAD/DEAH box helicase [Bacteroidales bacterium]
MLTFKAMGFSPNLLKAIEELGFLKPTPIQEEIIPLIFDTDSDITGLAQTGTGKTAAFGLPLIEQIDIHDKQTQVLILAPTRELCMQISKDFQNYSKYNDGLRVVPVYGGANIDTQIRALKKGAHIIAATPGRMLDLMKRKVAKIDQIQTLVLDEADEMLNMGFKDELDAIMEKSPGSKRTLLFSATMSKEVSRIAQKYLKDPVRITIGKQNSGAENIQHMYYQVHAQDRYLALKRIADINPNIYGIVFCRTRQETKDVADKLIKDAYNADALHGDLSQAQRDHVMKRFRERSLQMLVATDVAARGIDVQEISHVINYNLPDELEIYTHRSGRTGRADKSGIAISILNYREVSKVTQIEKMIGKRLQKLPLPSGEEICKKQLFNMIDRMENVEVDEAQIEPFMEAVNKKLSWLTKEQIIKRFVSLEFNRFLKYYRDAPDLNKKANSPVKVDAGRKDRKRKGSGKEDFQQIRSRRKPRGNYVRFFLNLGNKDGLIPKNVIGMINDNAQDRDINIGDIDIKDSFSFFEVEEKFAPVVHDAMRHGKFKGRKVKVELALENESKGKKKKAKGKKKR